MSDAMERSEKGLAETVAERLIDQLEKGTAPWQRPWKPGELQMPFNPATEKPYRGFNSVWLLSQNHGDPRWLTYRQANEAGAQVRKGERGTKIQYMVYEGSELVRDENGKPKLDAEGNEQRHRVEYERPRVVTHTVFNATQIDGLPPLQAARVPEEWERHQRAEGILANSGVAIRHEENGIRAFYCVATDDIHMPERTQFPTADGYYATALHELGHATGHPSRLNRDLGNPFGSKAYAKEELRAEIASMMLGEKLGIGHDPGQHAAYVASWVEILKEKPTEIFRAAQDAEKITTFVMELDREHKQQNEWKPQALIDELPHGLVTDPRTAPAAQTIIEHLNQGHPDKAMAATFRPDGSSTPDLVHVRKSIQEEWGQWRKNNGVADNVTPAMKERIELLARMNPELTKPEPQQRGENLEQAMSERTYLHVPFRDKDDAKAAGAKWDKEVKRWYAPEGQDLEPLKQWLNPPEKNLDPREEFAKALEDAGLVLAGDKDHPDGKPIMDGELHRVPVKGDKKGELGGAYVGHLDGHPAGFIQNFPAGTKENWKSENVASSLTPADRERLAKENAERIAERDAERDAGHREVADKSKREFERLQSVDPQHPYLVKKGLDGTSEGLDALRQDKDGKIVIPAVDLDGKIWTLQRIDAEGQKGFDKGGTYAGRHFNAVGERDDDRDPIVITEGWATGEDIRRESGMTVVVAFSRGNLEAVAKAIREEEPDRPIIIAGDNDHEHADEINPNTGQPRGNAGAQTAKEVAELVHGYAAIPEFEKGEKGSDWNDWRQQHGKEDLKKEMALAAVLADRRLLADREAMRDQPENIAMRIQRDANELQGVMLDEAGGVEVPEAQNEAQTDQALGQLQRMERNAEHVAVNQPGGVKEQSQAEQDAGLELGLER